MGGKYQIGKNGQECDGDLSFNLNTAGGTVHCEMPSKDCLVKGTPWYWRMVRARKKMLWLLGHEDTFFGPPLPPTVTLKGPGFWDQEYDQSDPPKKQQGDPEMHPVLQVWKA